MDSVFFAVLTEAAEVESTRNPALGARLTSLAQTLLRLRTLVCAGRTGFHPILQFGPERIDLTYAQRYCIILASFQ